MKQMKETNEKKTKETIAINEMTEDTGMRNDRNDRQPCWFVYPKFSYDRSDQKMALFCETVAYVPSPWK